MYKVVPELAKLLDPYLKSEVSLLEMRDQLYLNLQEFFGESTEDDMEMLSEVLACIYEVEDGVMPEDTFRQAVTQFIREHSASTQKTFAYRKKIYRISVTKPYRISVRQHGYAPRATSKNKRSVSHFRPRLRRSYVRNKYIKRSPSTRGKMTSFGVVR